MDARDSTPETPAETALGALSRGRPPHFRRSLVTSAVLHGTILCAAILLTPGVRHAAGKVYEVSSLAFAQPNTAPANTSAQAEPWREVASPEPPEPELVELPMEPAPDPEPLEEPELAPMADPEHIWARLRPGAIARIAAPPAEPGPGLPAAEEPVDQARETEAGPPEATLPVLVAAPPPEYPAIARRLGLEGSVLLRLHVSEHGHLLRCEVVDSSGSDRLDRAAVEGVRAWSFLPATSGGVAVKGELLHRVTFGLEA